MVDILPGFIQPLAHCAANFNLVAVKLRGVEGFLRRPHSNTPAIQSRKWNLFHPTTNVLHVIWLAANTTIPQSTPVLPVRTHCD